MGCCHSVTDSQTPVVMIHYTNETLIRWSLAGRVIFFYFFFVRVGSFFFLNLFLCPGTLWDTKLPVCIQVSVFGFGADQQGNWHHYWEENRYAGAFRKTGVHNAEFETLVIHRLAKEGKISLHLWHWPTDWCTDLSSKVTFSSVVCLLTSRLFTTFETKKRPRISCWIPDENRSESFGKIQSSLDHISALVLGPVRFIVPWVHVRLKTDMLPWCCHDHLWKELLGVSRAKSATSVLRVRCRDASHCRLLCLWSSSSASCPAPSTVETDKPSCRLWLHG